MTGSRAGLRTQGLSYLAQAKALPKSSGPQGAVGCLSHGPCAFWSQAQGLRGQWLFSICAQALG